MLGKAWPPTLSELAIVIVNPRESSCIHAEFLNDPAPTDVISFDHGELIICPAIAEQQRHIEGLSLTAEILTYIIHGCLHLCGYDDHSEKDFHRMRRKQTQIRNNVLKSKE
jgi:probable rRNA maturation factor